MEEKEIKHAHTHTPSNATPDSRDFVLLIATSQIVSSRSKISVE